MKTDLRIQKSKKAIEEAFIQLVEIKGFANVTIKEIAEKAVVNRNTIYLNYGSKEGILESMIKEAIAQRIGSINLTQYKRIITNKRRIQLIFSKFVSIVNENIELYRVVLLDEGAKGYLDMETQKLRKLINQYFAKTPKNDALLSFYLSGVWGVIKSYIIYAGISEEEVVKILTDLTVLNLRQIETVKKGL